MFFRVGVGGGERGVVGDGRSAVQSGGGEGCGIVLEGAGVEQGKRVDRSVVGSSARCRDTSSSTKWDEVHATRARWRADSNDGELVEAEALGDVMPANAVDDVPVEDEEEGVEGGGVVSMGGTDSPTPSEPPTPCRALTTLSNVFSNILTRSFSSLFSRSRSSNCSFVMTGEVAEGVETEAVLGTAGCDGVVPMVIRLARSEVFSISRKATLCLSSSNSAFLRSREICAAILFLSALASLRSSDV